MDTPRLDAKDRIEQLKTIRRHLGWSEEFCAHQLGVTYSTLNRWERGASIPRSRVVLNAIDQFIIRYHQPGASPAADTPQA